MRLATTWKNSLLISPETNPSDVDGVQVSKLTQQGNYTFRTHIQEVISNLALFELFESTWKKKHNCKIPEMHNA